MRYPLICGAVIVALAWFGACSLDRSADPGVDGSSVDAVHAPVAAVPTAARAQRARAGSVDAAPEAQESAVAALATADRFPPFAYSGGPLLVLTDADGTFVLDPEGSGDWHALLPANGREAQVPLGKGAILVWSNPHVARLTPQSADASSLFAALTRQGQIVPLFPERRVTFLTTRGRSVFVLDQERHAIIRGDVMDPEAGPSFAYTELDAGGAEVESVVAFADTAIFVATRGDDHVLRIALDGRAPRRLTVNATDGRLRASPSGRFLAVAADLRQRGNAGASPPSLRVIDCDDDRETVRIESIDIHVSGLSSQTPSLEMSWPDDRRLRYSETTPPPDTPAVGDLAQDAFVRGGHQWVEIDAWTGAQLAAVPYSRSLGLHHAPPPVEPILTAPSSRTRVGQFSRLDSDLFFGDDTGQPAARATWTPNPWSGNLIAVAPGGRWAIAAADDSGRQVIVLLDGKARTLREVFRVPRPEPPFRVNRRVEWQSVR